VDEGSDARMTRKANERWEEKNATSDDSRTAARGHERTPPNLRMTKNTGSHGTAIPTRRTINRIAL
jgi:hypothetical protein